MDRARLVVLLLLAVGVRLLFWESTSPDAATASVDAWGYHRLALNLDRGNGFSLRREAPFVPDGIRTPLYPAFLWLVRRTLGPAPRLATLIQAALDGCATALTWWLASRLAGRRAGRIAALLYALNPTQVRYTGELLTETLLSFLLTASTCLFAGYVLTAKTPSPKEIDGFRIGTRPSTLPPRAVLLVGALLLGLSILCKPNVLFLPLVWMLALALAHRRRWRHTLADTALLAAIVVTFLTPWIARNASTFGRPFLSTAFEGNISRISVPATLSAVRGQYNSPWSDPWEAIFGEIVAAAAEEYGWSKPWESLGARELDTYNHQVYLVARQVLLRHPAAWLASHAQGMVRYLEPQTYRVCYARFTRRDWPPDILDDAVILVVRAILTGHWAEAGQIIAQERWSKLDGPQRMIWWGTFAGQVISLGLALCGAWRLRRRPALVLALVLTIAYVLWVPGPIAYERFRVPVTSHILALVGASCSTYDTQTARQETKSLSQNCSSPRPRGRKRWPLLNHYVSDKHGSH